MSIDHSKTYKEFKFKNIPHIVRLNKIKKFIRKYKNKDSLSYADVGCSNGYLTNEISKIIDVKNITGFDWSDNIPVASKTYPDINFLDLNLNIPNKDLNQFDLVTCFETLEHVGNIENAIDNIISMKSNNGLIIISVPIESGPIGLIKYLIKRLIYRYDFPFNDSELRYFIDLLFNNDISKYRPKQDSWGSHFGFDYREVNKIIRKNKDLYVKAHTIFTTKFFIVKSKSI